MKISGEKCNGLLCLFTYVKFCFLRCAFLHYSYTIETAANLFIHLFELYFMLTTYYNKFSGITYYNKWHNLQVAIHDL